MSTKATAATSAATKTISSIESALKRLSRQRQIGSRPDVLCTASPFRKLFSGRASVSVPAKSAAGATAHQGRGAPRATHATSAMKAKGATWKTLRSTMRAAVGSAAYAAPTARNHATSPSATAAKIRSSLSSEGRNPSKTTTINAANAKTPRRMSSSARWYSSQWLIVPTS